MRHRLPAILCVLTALVSAPVFAAGPGPEAVDDAWVKAVKAGDIEAVIALYSSDAVMFPPDSMTVKGRDAIRAYWGGFLSANKVTEAAVLERGYKTSANFATGWGRFSMTFQPKAGGAPVTMEGRFTEVMVKKDGKWLYAVDHASAPLPPPPK